MKKLSKDFIKTLSKQGVDGIESFYPNEKQLKDLRSEHITTKSQLMYVSKQTEVEKLVNNKGLRSTKDQPFVLIK